MKDPVIPVGQSDWSTAEELGNDVLERVANVAEAPASESPMALTGAENRILAAIGARIFPTTDTPGAIEAGATSYVDLALGGAYASSLSRYREGLGELELYCTAQLGASFIDMGEEQQDEVLRSLQAGEIAEVHGGAEFFALVRRHILEGVFCEPSYGGNRDLVGWALVGFPGQRYGYPDPYINRVVDLPPISAAGIPRPEVS